MRSNKPKKPSQTGPQELRTIRDQAQSPTADEKAALQRHNQRRSSRPPSPRLKVQHVGKNAHIAVDHKDLSLGRILLAEALGTTDPDFADGLVVQLGQAVRRNGQIADAELNFVLAVIKDSQPRDQLESMLAAQMAVVHLATMALGAQLNAADGQPWQESTINSLTKLARTFTTQLDAFKRYRTGGEQKVTVQHVNVSDGGQAIVGNITTRSRKPSRQTGAPALAHSAQTPMPKVDTPQAAPISADMPTTRILDGKK